MKRKCRQYDHQFKVDVVDHCLSSNKSIRKIAEAFDVNATTLYGWIKEYK